MNDDLIRSLQKDWQAQEYEAGHVLRRLRRARWAPHFVLGIELAGCLVALAAGVWFAWIAAHPSDHRLLYALSAALLLVTAPVLGAATALARRPGLAWDEETPESILRIGIQRAEASLRAMRVGRWHIVIVAAFVALLWTLELLRLIHAREFLVFYTAVCSVVSVGSWVWIVWRSRRLRAEREECRRLLASLQG